MKTRALSLSSALLALSLAALLVAVAALPLTTSAQRLVGTVYTGCLPLGAESKGKKCTLNKTEGVCDEKGNCVLPEITPEKQKEIDEATKTLVNTCTNDPNFCKSYMASDQCDDVCKRKMNYILGLQTPQPDPLQSLQPQTAQQPPAGTKGAIELPAIRVEGGTPEEGIRLIYEAPKVGDGGNGPANGQTAGRPVTLISATARSKQRQLTPSDGDPWSLAYGLFPTDDYYQSPLEDTSGVLPNLPPLGNFFAPFSGNTFSPSAGPSNSFSQSNGGNPTQTNGNTPGSHPTSAGQNAGNPNTSGNSLADLMKNAIQGAQEFWDNLFPHEQSPFSPEEFGSTAGPADDSLNTAGIPGAGAFTESGPSTGGIADAFENSSPNDAALSSGGPDTGTSGDTPGVGESPSPAQGNEPSGTDAPDSGTAGPETPKSAQDLGNTARAISDMQQSLRASENEGSLQNNESLREALQNTEEKLAETERRAQALQQELANRTQLENQKVQELTQELNRLTEDNSRRMSEATSPEQKYAIAQQFLDSAGNALTALEKAVQNAEASLEHANNLPPTLGDSLYDKLSQGLGNVGNAIKSLWDGAVNLSQSMSNWMGTVFRSLFGF